MRTHRPKAGRHAVIQRRSVPKKRIRRDQTTLQEVIQATDPTMLEHQQPHVDEPIMSHIILSLPDDEAEQMDNTETFEELKIDAGPRAAGGPVTPPLDKKKPSDLGPPFDTEPGAATKPPAGGIKKKPSKGEGGPPPGGGPPPEGGPPPPPVPAGAGGATGIDATPPTPKKKKKNKGHDAAPSSGLGAGPPPETAEKAMQAAGIDATPPMPAKHKGPKAGPPPGEAGPPPLGAGPPPAEAGPPPLGAGPPPGGNIGGLIPAAERQPAAAIDMGEAFKSGESPFDKSHIASSEMFDSALSPIIGFSDNPLSQLTMLQDRLLRKLSELEAAFRGDKMLREKTEQAAAMILAKVAELEGKIQPEESKSEGLDRIAQILERLGPVEDKTLLMATHNVQKDQGGGHALVGRLHQMMKGYGRGYGGGYNGGYVGGYAGGYGNQAMRPQPPPFVQNNIVADTPVERRNSGADDSDYEYDYLYDSDSGSDQSSDIGSGSDTESEFETNSSPSVTVAHSHRRLHKHHKKTKGHENEVPTRRLVALRGTLYIKRKGYNLTLSMLKPNASLNLTEIRHPNPGDVIQVRVPIREYLARRTRNGSWSRVISQRFGLSPKTANQAYRLTTLLLANGSMLESEWTSWSSWGACTATCGTGYSVRRRVCVTWKRNNCEEQRQEVRECSRRCPVATTTPTEDKTGWLIKYAKTKHPSHTSLVQHSGGT